MFDIDTYVVDEGTELISRDSDHRSEGLTQHQRVASEPS